jgi:tetratricopeptide (TPR) repeat protein
MTTTRVDNDICFGSDTLFYNDQINKIIDHNLPQFDRIAKSYVFFNITYLTVGLIEGILFVIFFTSLAQTSFLAMGLAAIFLTLFSYFVLRLYIQSNKTEQMQQLLEKFIKSCKILINYNEEIPEHHLILANACAKFATQLGGREYKYYMLPSFLKVLTSTVERWSFWWHWQDVLKMREILFLSAAEEHIKLVKTEPTSLEVHVALANVYVVLTSLYREFREADKNAEGHLSLSEQHSKMLEEKYRNMAEKAIEEFKILSDYAPDDPWVHMQLAYSYHDLGMPLEEIKEYEAILQLCPSDNETLFKLGVLYFQQGFNSKGLKIYEALQRRDGQKAIQLIHFYGENSYENHRGNI